MKDGEIEEKGTHEELTEGSQGGYASLYNSEIAND
jgi:ABC-type transport system involved in Fe-S cluster assembly fused permease/ATPase subunit